MSLYSSSRNGSSVLYTSINFLIYFHFWPSEHSSAADPGAVKTNIMREIPSPVSTMAYTAMKLLGVLQSSETGVSSIIDAALAPPVSIRTQNPLLQLWSGLLKNQDCVVAPSCATRNTLLDYAFSFY